MQLTPQQLEQFDRDGYLVFPELFSREEVATLRREVSRLSTVEAEEVVREHTGGVRTIFRVHENDGATRSGPFRALVRTPRVLRPVQQALGSDEVYVYHTKINTKPAIEGTAYKFWAIPKQRMIDVLKSSPPPVALVGRAGMGVLFHCNTLHASGHNLSAEDRWHIYISCNTVANAPQFGPQSRPDWVVSRNVRPLAIEDDQGVLKAA